MSWQGMEITYVEQTHPKGLAHAVSTARTALGSDDFLMFLGDNVLKGGVSRYREAFEREKPEAMVLLSKVDHPEQFGVAAFKGERLSGLVEKPKIPPSNLALVGIYFFRPSVHEVIAHLEPSGRGEFEITDALQGLMDRGKEVGHMRVDGWWKDTGQPEDIVEANRLLLEGLEDFRGGEIRGGRTNGILHLGEGALLEDSVVDGPVFVGAGAVVRGCSLGPGTAIGQGCRLQTVEITGSIVMDHCVLAALTHPLVDSLIGEGCSVQGSMDSSMRLVLGDRSCLGVPD